MDISQLSRAAAELSVLEQSAAAESVGSALKGKLAPAKKRRHDRSTLRAARASAMALRVSRMTVLRRRDPRSPSHTSSKKKL